MMYLRRTCLALAGWGVTVAIASSALAQVTPMSDADMAALVEAAKAEGTITLYSGQGEQTLQQYLDAFEAVYGIKGQFVRATGNAVTQRVAAEAAGGGIKADVIGTSEGPWFDENPQYFVPLTQQGLPSLAEWPEGSYNDTHFIQTLAPLGLQYNTDAVPADQVPQKWTDLLDPKWKGRLLVTDPQGSANYTGWVHAMANAHGVEYLSSLAGQDLLFVASGATAAQQIAAGAKDLSFPVVTSFSVGLKGEGAPIEFVAPSDPSLVYSFNYGLVANSPSPNAGKLFMNWLLSPDGLKIACASSLAGSLRDADGAIGCQPLPQDRVPLEYNLTTDQSAPLFEALGVK